MVTISKSRNPERSNSMVMVSAPRRAGSRPSASEKSLLSDEKKKAGSLADRKKGILTFVLIGLMCLALYISDPKTWNLSASNSLNVVSSNARSSNFVDNRFVDRKMTDYHDVCIIGAGLSGGVIAERYASQRNQTSLILERRDHIGGNCYDYIDDETGIRVSKYGAHLFHTYYERVWKYVQKFSDWTPYEHEVIGLVDGKHVPIPVNIETVNILFDLNITNSEEMDKWLETEQEKYPNGPQNSEEMAKARVGTRLYELIFHPYTIKQWAKEPRELGPEVTARIPVRNDFDRRYFSDPHQALPSNGYTAIFEKMFDNPLISVHLNTDFFDVRQTLKCGMFYYTGPVDRYFADKGLKKLEYRSLDFERRVVKNIGFYQPKGVVNHPAAADNFTRIVEYKHFLNQTSDHTVLFLEHSKDYGEPYYPVPNPENKELFAKYKAMSDKEPGVSFVGRLANYKYFNMDQTIENALALFDKDSKSADLIVNYCNSGDIKKILPKLQSKQKFNNTYLYSSCGKDIKIDDKKVRTMTLPKGSDGFLTHMERKDITFSSHNVFVQAGAELDGEEISTSLKKIRSNKVFVDFAKLPFVSCEESACARNMAYNPVGNFVVTKEGIKRFIYSFASGGSLRGKGTA
jgi:UDP-galactopyranose mutase